MPLASQVDNSPPADDLQLEWVYGFRGFDTRRAALWASDKESAPLLVYPAAAVVVVYNLQSRKQTFFREHKDDVLGVTVHRKRGLIASSQKSYRERGRTRKPTIWVWRIGGDSAIETLKGPLVFTGCNQRWVSLLCFNNSGDLLISVGADDDNTLVMWDWERGIALCHVPTQKERIFGSRFDPFTSRSDDLTASTSGQDFHGRLVLAGKGFLRLYHTEELVASGLGERHGDVRLPLPGRERAVSQLSVGFLRRGVTVVGSSSGSLHVFEINSGTGTLLCTYRNAHVGPIHVLCETESCEAIGSNIALLSCGKDGAVRGWCWDDAGRRIRPALSMDDLALRDALPMINAGGLGARLRAMDWSERHGLLLGSHASELLPASSSQVQAAQLLWPKDEER